MRVQNGNQSQDIGLMLEVKGQRGQRADPFIKAPSAFHPLTFTRSPYLQCLQPSWS